MRRIKLVIQMLVAFIMATFAYAILYQPHQETVRAAVQQQLSKTDIPKAAGPALASGGTAALPAGKLRITLLDVGQGYAILLEDGQRKIMVDVGDNKKDKLGYGGSAALKMALAKAGVQEGVDKINTVIISHHHGDHLGNIKWLAGKYKVSNIYDNAMPNTSNAVSQWLNKELRAGHYHNRVLKAGDRVDLGKGYYFEVLAPGDFLSKQDKARFNNTSIVMKLHYGQFTMLFTGDAEAPVEDYLQQKYGSALKADVLKVGHHGSKTSSTAEFLKLVQPESVVMSLGVNNQYGHPHEALLNRLQKQGIKNIYRTDANGTITIVSDGSSYSITTEK